MSQQEADRLRAAFRSLAETGEFDPDWFDPDIRWHLRADLPDSETLVGRHRLSRFLNEWTNAFDEHHFELEELLDAGEHVIIVMRLHGRLRGSTEEVGMQETHVYKTRDGKTVEVWEYGTKVEALESLGLTE
jgi:ketosteroid isomerase-like protein